MTKLLTADTIDELREAILELDLDVPRRSEGRSKQLTERYCIAQLLLTLPSSRLSFPLLLEHSDKPDFLLAMPSGNVGIEHTEAVAENVARAQFLREKGLGPDMHFIPHTLPGESRKTAAELRDEIEADEPGYGWEGDAPEREWAEAMAHFAKIKMGKASAADFRRYSNNTLVIYDNWSVPSPDPVKAFAMLAPLLTTADIFEVFDTVYVLNESTLFEFGPTTATYDVGHADS